MMKGRFTPYFLISMPTNLNDRAALREFDSMNMLGSIEKLADQVREIMVEAKGIKIPASYKKVNNIVVLGMGGSALGARIIKTVFQDSLKIPLDIINNYHAPASVNSKTLVISSSYSGTPEEAI